MKIHKKGSIHMRIKESGGPGLHQFPCKHLSVRGEGGMLDEWTRRKDGKNTQA